MKYNNRGYNRLLVGDFYHWELDQSGFFVIKENSSKQLRDTEMEFETIEPEDIMEDLKDV